MQIFKKLVFSLLAGGWVGFFISGSLSLIVHRYSSVGLLFGVIGSAFAYWKFPRLQGERFLYFALGTFCVPLGYLFLLLVFYLCRLDTVRFALVTWVAAVSTVGLLYLGFGCVVATVLWILSRNKTGSTSLTGA